MVQILVVVANTQVRPLRTKVEKGSMRTVVVHGSVGPKAASKEASLCLFQGRNAARKSLCN